MNEIYIRPRRKFSIKDIKELWVYRDLLYTFIWRDIKVRYKQTFLGIVWVILQPIVSMVIFTVLFGNLAKVPSGKLPYSLFVLIGLVYWTFFSTALTHANDSMVSHENIIKKIYFPKILLPLSAVFTSFIDFSINLVLLLGFASILGYIPNPLSLIIFPVTVIITSLTAFGLGLFLSSLNVKYRDVRYILPYIVQILFYLSPVIYPMSIISERNRYIMALNPMSIVIESARLMFSNETTINIQFILIATISSLVVLLIGLLYFRKTERFFADIV